jgi:hypothetical protein
MTSVTENIIYENYGKMNAAELIEGLSGSRLPNEIRKNLNSKLKR